MRIAIYTASVGEHLSHATRMASAVSRRMKRLVKLEFNGVKLIAAPKKSPATLEWEFTNTCSRKLSKHRNSPEGRLETRIRRDVIIAAQQSVEFAVDRIKDSAAHGDIGALFMQSIKLLIRSADDVDVHFDKAALAKTLAAMGFVSGDLVGSSEESLKERSRMQRWIIGQIIDMLKAGMPPHPCMEQFVTEWEGML